VLGVETRPARISTPDLEVGEFTLPVHHEPCGKQGGGLVEGLGEDREYGAVGSDDFHEKHDDLVVVVDEMIMTFMVLGVGWLRSRPSVPMKEIEKVRVGSVSSLRADTERRLRFAAARFMVWVD
jgi:hypothetical protein